MSATGFTTGAGTIRCDGCGQAATTEHLSRRLQRLEWATRYRPVHIHTLLLGGVSPRAESDFLYAPDGEFSGEAARVLEGTGIAGAGRTKEAVHADFQKQGFYLTHVLECPLEEEAATTAEVCIQVQMPAILARIRRSLKPKRMVVVSLYLARAVTKLTEEVCGCPVVLDDSRPFALDGSDSRSAASRLRTALSEPVSD